MRKSLLLIACVSALAMTARANAALVTYSLVIDGAYTDSSESTPLDGTNATDGITGGGTSITLPEGTTSGFVNMAIVATIDAGSSVAISGDGFATAYMNFTSTANGGLAGGTAYALGASQNNYVNANAATYFSNGTGTKSVAGQFTGPSGASSVLTYSGYFASSNGNNVILNGNYASPVEAIYDTGKHLNTSTAKVYEFPTSFGTGVGANTGVVSPDGSTIGYTGPVQESDFFANYSTNCFDATYGPPLLGGVSNGVPTGATLVNRSTNGNTSATTTALAAATNPASMLMGANGINNEFASFVLGTVNMNITAATGGGTSTVGVTPADFTNIADHFAYSSSFMVNGVQYISLSTSATNQNTYAVTANAIVSASPVSIIIAGPGPGGNVGRADLSALMAPNGVQVGVLSGLTGNVTGTITNTSYTSPQDALTSWGVSGTGTGTVTPYTSGGALGVGSSSSFSATYTAPSSASLVFGPDVLSITGLGTGSSGPALTNSPLSVTVNVIGVATRGGTDGASSNSFGSTFSTGTLASGASYAGLETTLSTATSGATSFGMNQTTATILAGINGGSGSTTVTMAWRARDASEEPVGGTRAAGMLPLYSDVVNLGGTVNGGGSASTYTLQMSYDPAQVGTTSYIEHAASSGVLYLGYYSTSAGKWVNATAVLPDGDTGTGGSADADFLGSWTAFTSSGAPGDLNTHSLASLLGSWGVDTVNNVVWAVVDHNSQFAAVPEPGTLALLAAGLAALGLAYRRKLAKA